MKKTLKESPKVLGLDVSTKTIGWALFDIQSQELLELTHISPIPKPKEDNKIKELLLKGEIFRTKLLEYKDMGISKVIIEEPLLNSNNVYTVQTLLRFNTLITKTIPDMITKEKNKMLTPLQQKLQKLKDKENSNSQNSNPVNQYIVKVRIQVMTIWQKLIHNIIPAIFVSIIYYVVWYIIFKIIPGVMKYGINMAMSLKK